MLVVAYYATFVMQLYRASMRKKVGENFQLEKSFFFCLVDRVTRRRQLLKATENVNALVEMMFS